MNTSVSISKKLLYGIIAGLVLAKSGHTTTLSLAQYPLFLNGGVSPNILVIYDNSESMDGTMAGKLIAGSDSSTRGNIARSVIKSVVTSYRTQFNWGLETFGLSGSPALYNTYAYYLGDSSSMVFTTDCVNGISASNGGLRCVQAPQSSTVSSVTYNYVTYAATGDDPSINDVLYTSYSGAGMWGVQPSGYSSSYSLYYDLFNNHNTSKITWNISNNNASSSSSSNDFYSPSFGGNPIGFSPTDAGFLPSWPTYTRQVYVPRAWGYLNSITGTGNIVEAVKADSVSGHYTNLMNALASETNSTSSSEMKNAAVYTPLAGSLSTAKSYFTGSSTPIQYTCQKNFILLATDGNPTGKTNGNQYDSSQWQSSTSGQAYLDVYSQIQGLRSVKVSNVNYDIETYVVGMGDTVANANSVAGLNQMASYGGTDNAYLANDVTGLTNAFQAIATNIVSKTAAASSVSLNTGSWNTGADLFQARFNSGDWSGQLLSYYVNQSGNLGGLRWDAGQVLNTQSWDTGRQILTYKPSAALGGRGVAFRWPQTPASPTSTEMDAAQSTWLSTNTSGSVDAYGALRLQYLRGDSSYESTQCGSCTPSFRSRPTSKLGDVVDSAPYYVGPPAYSYSSRMESVAYSTFANTYANRTPMVYIGGNDGMLHAFSANSGQELFAYVPTSVYPNLSQLTSSGYSHHFYVDGSPTVGDVFYNGAWHSLLVGSLRAGGQGLFALDVTDPSHFSESNASTIVRWEFTDANDSDFGNTFVQPLLVKTNNGRWSVIVSNGYNSTVSDGYASTTGHAVLFILDAETGQVTAKIDTLAGSTSTPNGLSGPTAVDTNGDNIADVVYAGDVLGNVWKFDISSGTVSNWKSAYTNTTTGAPVPLFASGQPITMKPDITKMPAAQGGYMVLFGTGEYLATTDPTTTSTQSFYGIWDKGSAVSSLSSLQQQSVVGAASGADSNSYRITTHAVDRPSDTLLSGDNVITTANYYLGKRGWYINLPTSGERAVTDPTVRGGRVIFNTLIPNTTVCAYGGSGWVMELDVNTGNRLGGPTFDTNGDNQLTSADFVTYNNQLDNTSGRFISSIPAMAAFMRPPQTPGKLPYEDKYLNTSSGVVTIVGETSGNSVQGRIFWQDIH